MSIFSDIEYAFRKLRRAPGFALTAILTLALGIGASTAIFSLLDQVSLRLLPVKNPEQLVQLRWDGNWNGSNTGYAAWSYPWYEDLQRESGEIFEELFGCVSLPMAVSQGAEAEQTDVALVTGNYFGALGVGAARGRTIGKSDDMQPGGHAVAVLSHDYWRDRFGMAPDAIGQTIRINQHPFEIIGVARAGFRGLSFADRPSVFIPSKMKDSVSTGFHKVIYRFDNRRGRWLNVFGRLRPDLSRAEAEAALQPIHQAGIEYDLLQPELSGMSDLGRERYREARLRVDPGGQGPRNVRERLDSPLAMLMAMVALLLLIACGNVANLLMARAAGRAKEIALRFAFGAGRFQIVRQLLVESAILAFVGGGLGLLFADTLTELIIRLSPNGPDTFQLTSGIDWRILAFAATVSALTTFVFGLAPALRTTRLHLARTLKDQAGSITGGNDSWRRVLAASQVFFSLLLLIAAGLFQQSLLKLRAVDVGMNTEQTLVFSIDPLQGGYEPEASIRFLERFEKQLAARPEIAAAGHATVRVLADRDWTNTVSVEGYERAPDENMNPYYNAVSPGYFETLEVPVVKGRNIRESDVNGAPRVGIVNASFEKRYFADGSAIGRKFGFGGEAEIEIVGVVPDLRYQDLRQDIPEQVFVPFAQAPWPTAAEVFVRTPLAPEQAVPAVRSIAREMDASLPVAELRMMREQVESTLTVERLLAFLASTFGALAGLLAAIGLYGLLSYSVARRKRELGLRMALGAERGDLAKLVLNEVAWLFALGAVPAIPAALALSRFLESQLYGVAPNDPLSILAATALLAVAAFVAGALPAWRAARTQPMTALRFE